MMIRTASIVSFALLILSPAAVLAGENQKNIIELAREVLPSALHAELHNYDGNGKLFKHGVFPADLSALEAIYRDQPADATRIVELARRQNNNNTTTSESSSTPPSSPSTTPRASPTTLTPTTTSSKETSTSTTESPTSQTQTTPTETTTPTTQNTSPTDVSPTTETTSPTTETPTPTTPTETTSEKTTSTTKLPPRMSLSTSKKTTTINGQASTLFSVVFVTPTATAELTSSTPSPTATGTTQQLQPGAAAGMSAQFRNVVAGLGAVLTGVYFL